VRLWTLGGGTTEIGKIAIVEMGSTSDLDSADDRQGWRLVRSSVWGTVTPNIVPLGTTSATSADWALVVPAGMYSVGNENLPFQAGRTRVCYSTRKNPLNPASMESRIRVLDNGTQRTSQIVFHSASWQRFCTPWFDMTTARGTVQFGLDATTNGSYLIDDVTVERQ
jgi:hypothetical protein